MSDFNCIIKDIDTGNEQASKFHSLMIGIFEFLLYPNLTNPKKEQEINDGTKRIDICFTNSSNQGIFTWISEHVKISCPYIFFECKNYSKDIGNPELDQMIGRFSVRRGRLGIISCRKVNNMDLFLKRCGDSYKDDKGLIIPITDSDVLRCLDKNEQCRDEFEIVLKEKIDKIILK